MLKPCACAVCATTLCAKFVPWHQHAIGCPLRAVSLASNRQEGLHPRLTEEATNLPHPLTELDKEQEPQARPAATPVYLDAIDLQPYLPA
jgi:hypothetical protein